MFLLLGILLSSCGAIPTLPPLDATVTIKTPHFTVDPGPSEEEGQVIHQESGEKPAESPSAPPVTVAVQPQPTESGLMPTETAPVVEPETPEATEPSEDPAPPQPTPTPTSYPYTLQPMNPHYLGSFSRPDQGCDWLGVGGQIFDKDGVVQKDILIKAGGELAGNPVVEELTMPLAEPEIDMAYGPGGFEITLANAPIESYSTAWIQLYSLGGDPLSEQIYLVTYDDCSKNLLLMNFIEE
jgi:hypothetical protein